MEYLQKINSLRNNSSVLTVSPSFITSNGATIDMSSYFYVKLKSLNDVQLLHTISLAKNVEVIEQNQFMPLWFTLKCNTTTLDNALEVAEISIKMDNVLFNAWEKGGKKVAFLDNTNEEKRKIVKGNKVVLDHLLFDPNEVGTLKISFNFLTRELTEKSNYTYHIIQKDYFTDEIIGGETFVIKKPVRQPFLADAGETIMTDINQPITIRAQQINEAALYNWYDSNGELIFQGKDLTVSTDIVKKYKLEVIALTDGFKDYADVEVKLNPSKIESISPNPAVNQIQVNYKVNENTSAYLMVLGYYGGSTTSHNYIIDVNQSNYIINLSEYTQGFYTVALVCSGEIVDAKNFYKN